MTTIAHRGAIMPANYNSNWAQTYATAFPAAAAGMGLNYWTLDQQWNMSTVTDTTITTASAVPHSGITAQVTAARAAMMNICFKPRVTPAGQIQAKMAPGAFFSANGVTCSSSSTQVTCTGIGTAVNAMNAGTHRVANPNPGHYNDFGATGLDAYGTTTPTYNTVASVTSANVIQLTSNAAVTTSTGSIVITDDVAAATWFSNYTTLLDDNLGVIAPVAGDIIDLSTEHDYATLLWDANWRTLIAHCRSTYPGVSLRISQASLDGYGSVLCNDVLDVISLTWYKDVQSSGGGENLATILANWAAYNSGLQSLSTAWGGKLIHLGEIGYGSWPKPGHSPESPSSPNAEQEQAACYLAFLRNCAAQPWFGGFDIWEWTQAQTANQANENTSYSLTYPPTANLRKLAWNVIAEFCGGINTRALDNGTSAIRR